MTRRTSSAMACMPILRDCIPTLHKRTALAWDELRLVLAIGRSGTLSGGARRLAIDHSTAFRRLGALEARLGVRLFERARDGYVATPAGEAVIAAAASFDETVGELERRLAGQDMRPSGTLRLTTTDTLLGLLAPMLAAFRAAHPDILLEVVVANEFFTLTKRDADVAIRPAARAPDALVGRRIAEIASALYAAPAYCAGRADPCDLGAQDWIAPDETLGHLGSAQWMRANVPPERIVCRSNSLLALAAAARAGLGVTPLPCFLADPDPELERVQAPLPEMASALWLLTHRDLRRVARVRAFLDFMAHDLARQRPLLEGRAALRE
jgi:DNA-binding transcriptional LysR family regulator